MYGFAAIFNYKTNISTTRNQDVVHCGAWKIMSHHTKNKRADLLAGFRQREKNNALVTQNLRMLSY